VFSSSGAAGVRTTRTYGLRGALLIGLKYGTPIAMVITAGTLLLDDDAAIVVWGATMIFGATLVPLGLVSWAAGRVFMRVDARWSLDKTVQDPFPFVLRSERGLLWVGVPLSLTWLLLSGALLLRGETLF
jgi:hypothetical protein